MSTYVLYWLEMMSGVTDGVEHDMGYPKCKRYDELQHVLPASENLRARRRAGELISHITISIEHPDSIGELGVDKTKSDYDWKKRRS
jgi:hypothetical protein